MDIEIDLHVLPLSTSTDSLLDYLSHRGDMHRQEHEGDYVFSLFKKTRARKALTHVIFYAAVSLSILTILEIIAQVYHSTVNSINSLWILGLILVSCVLVSEIVVSKIIVSINKQHKGRENKLSSPPTEV